MRLYEIKSHISAAQSCFRSYCSTKFDLQKNHTNHKFEKKLLNSKIISIKNTDIIGKRRKILICKIRHNTRNEI